MTFQRPLVALLTALGKPLLNLVNRLLGRRPGKVLTKAVMSKDGKRKAWLEEVDGRVKVMWAGSPDQEVMQGEGVTQLRDLGRKLSQAGMEGQQAQMGNAPKSGKAMDTARTGKQAEDLLKPIAEMECPVGGGGRGDTGACFVAGTPVHTSGGPMAIEALRPGRRVRTLTPGERRGMPAGEEVGLGAGSRRLVRLALDAGGGNAVEAELLRSAGWLAAHQAEVGRSVFLDMPEMGIAGHARVTAIEPCPAVEEGEGGLVTGAFRHRRGVVYDLQVAGEDQPLGVTGAHPFWSVDRGAWVPAQGLRAGERLRGPAGTAEVRSLALRAGSEPVYNVEVEGDHCYRVGEQGLLVHNASVCPDKTELQAGYPTYHRVVKWYGNDITRIRTTKAILIQADETYQTILGPDWWQQFVDKYKTEQWEKGHLIGSRFGGPREATKNFAPFHHRFNVSAWETCEYRIAEAVKAAVKCKKCVEMTVTVEYEGDQPKDKAVPKRFRIQLKGLDGFRLKKAFDVLLTHMPNEPHPARCEDIPDNKQ
jgi:hypothetical protein